MSYPHITKREDLRIGLECIVAGNLLIQDDNFYFLDMEDDHNVSKDCNRRMLQRIHSTKNATDTWDGTRWVDYVWNYYNTMPIRIMKLSNQYTSVNLDPYSSNPINPPLEGTGDSHMLTFIATVLHIKPATNNAPAKTDIIVPPHIAQAVSAIALRNELLILLGDKLEGEQEAANLSVQVYQIPLTVV